MKSNIIVIIFIILFVILGLFIFGYYFNGGTVSSVQGSSNSLKLESALVTPKTLNDFGKISMKDGDVVTEFVITNPTENEITVTTILTSCMCTAAFIVEADGKLKGPFKMPGMGYVPPANEVIGPSESRIVRVVYDPNAHGPAGIGNINRFITITDSSAGKITFEIKALVTP